MLIDVHSHYWLAHLNEKKHPFSISSLFNGPDPLRQYVDYARRAKIDKIILCGNPDLISPEGCEGNPVRAMRRLNDQVRAACSRFPDLFVGGVMVHPEFVDESLKEIETRIEKEGFVGIGEICQYRTGHKTDCEGMREVLKLAAQLDVPVNIHASTPEHTDGLRSLMSAVPDATVIMAHVGGFLNWRNGIFLAKEFPNLFVDISGIVIQWGGTFKEVLANISHKRLLFGVDFPLIEFESVTAPFYASKMSAESREKIAYKNTLGIYKRISATVKSAVRPPDPVFSA